MLQARPRALLSGLCDKYQITIGWVECLGKTYPDRYDVTTQPVIIIVIIKYLHCVELCIWCILFERVYLCACLIACLRACVSYRSGNTSFIC